MVFSINSFAQLHISDSTVFSVRKNTVLYVVSQPSDTLPVIVKKEAQPKTEEQIAKQKKKRETPSQPPIVKKGTETENSESVLFFTSKHRKPVSLFYAGKTTKAALVNTGNFSVKIFPPKKIHNNTILSFLLNADDQKIGMPFKEGTLPKQQIHLEEHITRPPPFLSESHPEIL